MTTETHLDIEEIHKMWLETADIIPHCDHHVYFARAIEQAVLKSEQVKDWNRDSEHFNKVINMTRAECKESLSFDCDKDVIKAVYSIYENR